jgi:hypothetical protein
MPGQGPPPKPPGQRRRRNAAAGPVKLPATPKRRAPAFPFADASASTRAWWRTIWASPMAEGWLDADVPGLERLARLVELAGRDGVPMAVLTEIRHLEDRFGLSPMARRRLQWELEQNPPEVATSGSAREGGDNRWRKAVSD